MAIIISIHQPNQEIVLMFDKLYVLAKGGYCLFSGQPSQIRAYMTDSHIGFNEDQVPIEQLLKLASIETKEEYIEEMVDKVREELRVSVLSECQKNTKLSENGLKIRSKTFKPIDVWYITNRLMLKQYIRGWRSLTLMFAWTIFFAVASCKMFNDEIGKPSGCFNTEQLNGTCLKELENDSLLFQNQNFLFFISIMNMFVHFITCCLAYIIDVKIFFYEHQNGNLAQCFKQTI